MTFLRAFWNSLHRVLPSFVLHTVKTWFSMTYPVSAVFLPGLYPAAVIVGNLCAQRALRLVAALFFSLPPVTVPHASLVFSQLCLIGLMRFKGAELACIPCVPGARWVLKYCLLAIGKAFRWQWANSSTFWKATCWKSWTLPPRLARPGTWPSSSAWCGWGQWGWGWGRGGVWLQGENPGSGRARTRLSVTESRCLRGHVSQRHSQHFYLSSCHTCPTMFGNFILVKKNPKFIFPFFFFLTNWTCVQWSS